MSPKKLAPAGGNFRSLLPTPLTFLLFVGLVWLVVRFGAYWLRVLLVYLSQANWARNLAGKVPAARAVALRFVAGETQDDAVKAARPLNARGMTVTMDYLGESVTDASLARLSCEEIVKLLGRIQSENLDANVSVKLSQLGLKISTELAHENMRSILETARRFGNCVRIDMEESGLVEDTLALYRRLRREAGSDVVGVVIQAYLHRSQRDVEALIREGAWVRICKGAYAEPSEVAFARKADTDANFVRLTRMLLSHEALQNGVYLGVATHDENMIQATIERANELGLEPSQFEFQMLYGIRRDLQDDLVDRGYRLRVYVPYGTAWYPYFVRRLAERPANLRFFITNLLRD